MLILFTLFYLSGYSIASELNYKSMEWNESIDKLSTKFKTTSKADCTCGFEMNLSKKEEIEFIQSLNLIPGSYATVFSCNGFKAGPLKIKNLENGCALLQEGKLVGFKFRDFHLDFNETLTRMKAKFGDPKKEYSPFLGEKIYFFEKADTKVVLFEEHLRQLGKDPLVYPMIFYFTEIKAQSKPKARSIAPKKTNVGDL